MNYYTPKSLAAFVGVSIRTVRRWTAAGLTFKRGLISLEEFENWRQTPQQKPRQNMSQPLYAKKQILKNEETHTATESVQKQGIRRYTV